MEQNKGMADRQVAMVTNLLSESILTPDSAIDWGAVWAPGLFKSSSGEFRQQQKLRNTGLARLTVIKNEDRGPLQSFPATKGKRGNLVSSLLTSPQRWEHFSCQVQRTSLICILICNLPMSPCCCVCARFLV